MPRTVFVSLLALWLAACSTPKTAKDYEQQLLHDLATSKSILLEPIRVDSNDDGSIKDEAFKLSQLTGRPVVITINPITKIEQLGAEVGKLERRSGDPLLVTLGISERDVGGKAAALFTHVSEILLSQYKWVNAMSPSKLPNACTIEVSGMGTKADYSVLSVEVRCGLAQAIHTSNGIFVIRYLSTFSTDKFDDEVKRLPAIVEEVYEAALKLPR